MGTARTGHEGGRAEAPPRRGRSGLQPVVTAFPPCLCGRFWKSVCELVGEPECMRVCGERARGSQCSRRQYRATPCPAATRPPPAARPRTPGARKAFCRPGCARARALAHSTIEFARPGTMTHRKGGSRGKKRNSGGKSGQKKKCPGIPLKLLAFPADAKLAVAADGRVKVMERGHCSIHPDGQGEGKLETEPRPATTARRAALPRAVCSLAPFHPSKVTSRFTEASHRAMAWPGGGIRAIERADSRKGRAAGWAEKPGEASASVVYTTWDEAEARPRPGRRNFETHC